jgi:hypothetical protein
MRPDCEFEAEILAAAIESRWPQGADAALHVHATSCAVCSEAALVASALADDREMMRGSAHIPEPGRVWWLAQVRARREAVAAAGRPITIVQMCVFACATGVLGACFGATSSWFQSIVKRLATSSVAALLSAHPMWTGGTLALLLLFPAAAYFVIAKESGAAPDGTTHTKRATSAPK